MNYYEEIIEKLTQLIYDKKYDEASKIIDEELSMPYVPMDFESKLYEFKNKIIALSDTPETRQINEDKIFELLNSPKLDKVEKIGLIQELEKVNLRNHVDDFENIFSSDDFDDELKTVLIYLIYSQRIDHDFTIKYHSNDDQPILFNTYRNDLKEYEMVPLKIIDELEEELNNDNIQMFEMGKQLTTATYYNLFPIIKQLDPDELEQAIITSLYESNGMTYKPKKVAKELKKYMKLLKKNGLI